MRFRYAATQRSAPHRPRVGCRDRSAWYLEYHAIRRVSRQLQAPLRVVGSCTASARSTPARFSARAGAAQPARQGSRRATRASRRATRRSARARDTARRSDTSRSGSCATPTPAAASRSTSSTNSRSRSTVAGCRSRAPSERTIVFGRSPRSTSDAQAARFASAWGWRPWPERRTRRPWRCCRPRAPHRSLGGGDAPPAASETSSDHDRSVSISRPSQRAAHPRAARMVVHCAGVDAARRRS